MFECCVCKSSCDNAKSICFNCAREKELTDCFIKGEQNEVKNHLNNGRAVYGTIFGVKVKITPDR